jgi:hypothetical protein
MNNSEEEEQGIENNIIQKREEIIVSYNTAQENVLSLLDTLSKTANTFSIPEGLRGDIDFSIIKDRGFTHIQTISIQKGEITNIIGIPEGIINFQCSNNYLLQIADLPTTLENLNLSHNYLESIDLSKLKVLKVLNLSHNRVVKIGNFPPSLEEIYIDYNQLREIDLIGLGSLKNLDITENKITVVENLPENIVDFKYENNPTINFGSSINNTGSEGDDNDDDKNTEEELSYSDSLTKYFELKSKYDKNVLKMKKIIYEKYATSNKQKMKRKMAELKAPCIYCKRKVNSIFSIKNNRYMAICGDKTQPCKLNIELFRGEYQKTEIMLSIFDEAIKEIKDDIIRNKLNTLFDYSGEKESLSKFKKLMDLYNTDGELYKQYNDEYNEKFFNTTKEELRKKKMEKIYKYKEEIVGFSQEYEKTQNREFLVLAIEKMTKELYPEINNLRLLENEIMELYYDDKEEVYTIFKYPVALSKIESCIGEPYRVIKM